MGWLKEFDAGDAAFFITLTTLTMIAGIIVASLFTDIENNAIAMIFLGKAWAMLDGAIVYFFNKKPSEASPEAEPLAEVVDTVTAK
jgi:hypothetical protein